MTKILMDYEQKKVYTHFFPPTLFCRLSAFLYFCSGNVN